MKYPHGAASISLVAMMAAVVSPATSQSVTSYSFDIPSQPLELSLKAVARASGREILVSSRAVAGITAPALKGRYSVEQALSLLIVGTHIHAEASGGTILISDAGDAEHELSAPVADDMITVTGTRIKRGVVTSPTFTMSQSDIVRQGQADAGEALRALPQNYGGGQNPTLAPGGATGNQNTNGASAANLRGLGSDATLTLLNGHRLPYGSFTQSIDVGGLPLPAIDRIEVVADGASAIYGSDAVGGVVNVILKPDYDGIVTSMRVGGATEGGDLEQRYTIVGGRRWAGGGFIATYDFSRNSAILTQDRSYTAFMPRDGTLLSSNQQHSALISAHQTIGDAVTLKVDANYNHRFEIQQTAISETDGQIYHPLDVALSIAPSVTVKMGKSWTASLVGLYGYDNTHTRSLYYSSDGSTITRYCDCDHTHQVELTAEGPLLSLPAGEVRVAAGAGYRRNSYLEHSDTPTAAATDIRGSLDSYYGYGELEVPVVGPAQAVPAIHRLAINAALRYERYPSIGGLATPKFGLLYSPLDGVEIKGSWGKSFKAPTLIELAQGANAALYPASLLGGSNYGPGATVMLTQGGNSGLRPERATSWSAGATVTPAFVPGLSLSVDYFNVRYNERVVEPFNGSAIFSALSNNAYRSFVTYNPSPQSQAAVIAASYVPLYNGTDAAYDPSQVVAIVTDTYLNAARQKIHGIDLTAAYKVALGAADTIDFSWNGSWIKSKQQLSVDQPWIQLAGVLLNPARFHGRAAATWSHSMAELTMVVDHVGGITNAFVTPDYHGRSQTTLDLIGSIRASNGAGPLRGVALSVTINNLFDRHPPYAPQSGGISYYAPFDSANYSPIGRFMAMTLSKKW